MSIDPDAELFDSNASPPASAPPPAPLTPGGIDDRVEGFGGHWNESEEKIEGGGDVGDGGGATLVITVSDPQQIGEGRNAHTYYRIDVRQGHYVADPIASIRRRYSDFQWLFQRLHAEKPGAVVPIIPHTQAVQISKRLSEELVEERRVYLERFLRRVQVHPEFEGAPSLAAFFSPDIDAFDAAKVANPGNASTDVSADDEATTSTEKAKEKVKHFWVKTTVKVKLARGVTDLEDTRDGKRMEEVENYIESLDMYVTTLSRCTLSLVGMAKDASTTMHELGQSLFGLHQLYDPETNANYAAVVGVDHTSNKLSMWPSIKTISNVFASLSAVNKVKSDENQAKVGSPMREIQWMIKAARLAIKRRKNCQLTYNTYLQQAKNREASLDKVRAGADLIPGHGHSEKITEAQKLVEVARQSATKALAELDTVTQRVFREMDRFKRVVDTELRKLFANLARVEMEHSGQLDAEWKKLLVGGSVGAVSAKGKSIKPTIVPTSPSEEAEVLMI